MREDLGVLPPGDIRNCMIALSEDENLMSKLFRFRFEGKGDLHNHSFGNLFLSAMAGVTRDFAEAVRPAGATPRTDPTPLSGGPVPPTEQR